MIDPGREVRHWRALALAGAAASGLLTARVLVSPQAPLFRLLHPEFWPAGRGALLRRVARLGEPGEPVDEGDLFSETQAQQVIRRLEACEAHLADLEERLPAVIGSAIDAWHGKERSDG